MRHDTIVFMMRRRSKPLYRYRITRLGFHFLFVALFAIVGGSLRGFNLLLVLAGLLISVVIVQWRQGRTAIRRTRLIRQSVTGTYAGIPVSIRYSISNVGHWLPVWMIRIEDSLTVELPSSTNQPHADGPIELIGSIGNIPAGQTRSTSIICRFSQRGRYELGPLVASTTFPFCLMNCERLSAGSLDQMYVYPRLLELRRGWKSMLPPRRGGDGNRSTGGTNHDGEFFGLRPWQSGDHIKHIHWRTTARIGQPAVRQFEQRNRHQVCIIVDGVASTDGHDPEHEFELVLQLATTLLAELTSQTRSVALLMADALASDASEPNRVLESGGADLSKLYERLAIARRCSDDRSHIHLLAQSVADFSMELKRYDIIVISGRRFADAVNGRQKDSDASNQGLPGDSSVDRALSVWRFFDQFGRLSWLDVHSPSVERFLSVEDALQAAEQSSEVTANVPR